jgi:hypothetical protein
MLPDLLAPDLRIVFCETAVATASAERGHYYSGPGNKFWHLLHDAGLTPSLLNPEEDASLLSYGIGINGPGEGRGAKPRPQSPITDTRVQWPPTLLPPGHCGWPSTGSKLGVVPTANSTSQKEGGATWRAAMADWTKPNLRSA